MDRRRQRYPEPTVGALVLNRRGEVLLVKSHKWRDTLTIPGGHVEVGETLVHALKREIKEEVGLEIFDVRFLMVQEAIFSRQFWKKRHFVFFDYVCRCRSEKVEVDGDEIQEFFWLKPADAAKMKLDAYTGRMLRTYLSSLGARPRSSGGGAARRRCILR